MSQDTGDAAEAEIRDALDKRDYERAATLTIERYGAEILGFLATQLGDPEDAFAAFSETLWKTLQRFELRCSARTWAYKLARHAAVDHRRSEKRHARDVPLAEASQLSQMAAAVRSATAAYRKSAVKDRFRELRERLPEQDQLVLIMRVDRGLSWLELAQVMLPEEQPGEDVLRKEAARLRKRFQSVKERLRELADTEGLIE